MSKKYVIEIKPEYEDSFKGVMILGTKDSDLYVDMLAVENLEQYVPVDILKIYDKAYGDGYKRGLDDAWEAAKKLFSSMPESAIEKAFPIEWNNGGFNALMNLQPQEAIAKLKAYEDKRSDRIEVGDEVDWDGDKYVVTYLNYSFETSEIADYDLLAYDGSVVDHVKKCTFTKTGKHYDIASILEAMRK